MNCPTCGYEFDHANGLECPRCGDAFSCSSLDCGECGSCPSFVAGIRTALASARKAAPPTPSLSSESEGKQ